MATESSRQKVGAAAETMAAEYLTARGLRIIQRNFRVRGGEIDLIADHNGILVFVEVRLRSRNDFGGAGASITFTKQQRIILAARHYLQTHGERDCRFDCILLNNLNIDTIEWIAGAFSS